MTDFMWCLNIDTCALCGVFMFVCMLCVSICLCVCIFCVPRSYLHVSLCVCLYVQVLLCLCGDVCIQGRWYAYILVYVSGTCWCVGTCLG